MYSFKSNILSTLVRHNAGSLQDTIKIQFGLAVLFALGRPLGHKLHGVHLRPLDLGVGERHACAFNADRSLDDVQPRAGIYQPLHEAEIAAGYSFGRPQPDY